jgi:hypothetical protein
MKPNDTGHAKTVTLLHKNTIVTITSVPKKREIGKAIVCFAVHLEIRFNYPLEWE